MIDEKKQSDFDELEWQKACEAENNFQKAVEMEDREFVAKWLFFCPSKENESRENINPRLHP